MPEHVRAAYEGVVRALSEVPTVQQRQAGPGVPVLQLSPGARQVFLEFREEVEPRLHPERGDLRELGDWASKWPGACARIAGVLHCVEHGPRGDVGEGHMRAALEIGRYLLEHARRAFDMMAAPGEETDADAVVTWAKRAKLYRFKLRHLARLMSPREIGRSRVRREGAVREAVDRGLLVVVGEGEWEVPTEHR